MPKPQNCLKAIRKTLIWTTYMKFDCLVRVLRAYLIVPHDLFFSHFFFHFRRFVIDVNSLDIGLFGFRHLGWHHSSILCPLLWVQICLVGVKLLRFYPAIIFWWITLNTHQKFIFFKGEMRVTQIKPMLFYLMPIVPIIQQPRLYSLAHANLSQRVVYVSFTMLEIFDLVSHLSELVRFNSNQFIHFLNELGLVVGSMVSAVWLCRSIFFFVFLEWTLDSTFLF